MKGAYNFKDKVLHNIFDGLQKFRRIDHVKHPVSIGNSRQIIRAMDSS